VLVTSAAAGLNKSQNVKEMLSLYWRVEMKQPVLLVFLLTFYMFHCCAVPYSILLASLNLHLVYVAACFILIVYCL